MAMPGDSQHIEPGTRRVIRKTIGIALICIGIIIALAQVIMFHRWEWEQMPSLWHHEGIAWVTVVLGLLLVLSVRKRKPPTMSRGKREGSSL
jgi:uncharacterized protein involved in cysteine biosynthesis